MMNKRVLVALAATTLTGALVAGCGGTPPPASSPTSAPATSTPSRNDAALTAVAPTPVGGPSPSSVPRVPPEKQDFAFQAALARRNLTVADTPEVTAQYGRLICVHLGAGEPVTQLVGEVRTSAQVDFDNAGYVLGAATAVYCPDDLTKLPTG